MEKLDNQATAEVMSTYVSDNKLNIRLIGTAALFFGEAVAAVLIKLNVENADSQNILFFLIGIFGIATVAEFINCLDKLNINEMKREEHGVRPARKFL